jgi:uncharacterized protein (TIGR03437 family)
LEVVVFRLVRLLAVALFLPAAWPATLAFSTYFKDGFTPAALAADSEGNIIVAGSAVVDPKAQTTGAVVAKINNTASGFLYLTYLDSASSDQVGGIAVDSAGNAYIAGTTSNPNFPTLGGGTLGTPPANSSDMRSFVVKLNPQGAVVFSVLLGGSVPSTASGIALTKQGQILVSGIANATGFPTTQGVYRIPDSTNHWFLMEIDPTASELIFSATGIGGSSLALDPAGNIFMAGSSLGADYPTTPGAYQATMIQGYYCFVPCQISFPGELQHITKVDPAASKLIYSTGLNGGLGSVVNTGLAIDPDGNAYVTGTLFEGSIPLTVQTKNYYTSFLSKLDPTGAKLLFSIPAGGAGVALDSSGKLYASGFVTTYSPLNNPLFTPTPPPQIPSVFANLPAACLPDNNTGISDAYAIRVDPGSGDVLDGQWIDGSAPTAVGMVLADGKAWVTGSATAPDVPFTPGAINPFAPTTLGPGNLEGAWLAAADFSPQPGTNPIIACVLDAGNLTHVGAVTGYGLISIFGRNLGPAKGVAAPSGGATSLGGVSANFDGDNPAQLLYVSSTQINLAVPLPVTPPSVSSWPAATVMELKVNGVTVSRQFPYILTNLSLFGELRNGLVQCDGASPGIQGYQALAENADGSLNSCTNPAQAGSTVSFFMQGVGAEQLGFPPVSQISALTATLDSCSADLVRTALADGFVYQVDVEMPSSPAACAGSPASEDLYELQATFNYNGSPVGPFIVPPPGSLNFYYAPGLVMPMTVYVKQ